jgi:hypothetical protein
MTRSKLNDPGLNGFQNSGTKYIMKEKLLELLNINDDGCKPWVD